MGLFDLTDGSLVPVPKTSFSAEGVLERQHLQAALRANSSMLGDDLLVVAEEFGEFEGANRRIDLLCVDRAARLVVVELKRTDDGGHLELQALRYAAMVSTMTMDDLQSTYRAHLKRVGSDPIEAPSRLAEWLDDTDDIQDAVLRREVRIILVSAGFGKEITTTVLWLNDIYGLDIRCVRLTPYRVSNRLLLDVQPVIPLPEAAELTVRLRRREQAAKAATSSSKDYTRYVITTPAGASAPLPKRRAISAMVVGLHAAGVSAEQLRAVVSNAKLVSIDGELDDDELEMAFIEKYPSAEHNMNRWFFEHPLHENGQTWVLSKMWGLQTEATLEALLSLAPDGDFAYEAS